jgi:hypothetical protein
MSIYTLQILKDDVEYKSITRKINDNSITILLILLKNNSVNKIFINSLIIA